MAFKMEKKDEHYTNDVGTVGSPLEGNLTLYYATYRETWESRQGMEKDRSCQWPL